MSLLNFQSYAVWINAAIFAAAAGLVWFAGSRISGYADSISQRTGLGAAFVGLLLLALATETPEIATTVTAASGGNAELAIGNLFGGVVMQTAVIAVVDVIVLRQALTFFTPQPSLLLQGVLLTMLLGLTLAAATAGQNIAFWSVGLSSLLLFGAYVLSLYLSHQYEGEERWIPDTPLEEIMEGEDASGRTGMREQYAQWPMGRLIGFFLGGTLMILLAGFILARTGEAMANQIGLSQSFVGSTLLAISTSLPELSTALTAARLRNYSMAISNIFGSNAIMVALIFLADLFYRDGPILASVDAASRFTVAMGVVVTGAYVAGLVERRDQTIMRMGLDSFFVAIFYVVTLVVLYWIS